MTFFTIFIFWFVVLQKNKLFVTVIFTEVSMNNLLPWRPYPRTMAASQQLQHAKTGKTMTGGDKLHIIEMDTSQPLLQSLRAGKQILLSKGFIIQESFSTWLYIFSPRASVFYAIHFETVTTKSKRRFLHFLQSPIIQVHYATTISVITHRLHNEIRPGLLQNHSLISADPPSYKEPLHLPARPLRMSAKITNQHLWG